MDASQVRESIPPFISICSHLQTLGFSTPQIHAADQENGFILLEDFGDASFARLLDETSDYTKFYTAATDLLIALHKQPNAVPTGLRAYHTPRMVQDLELYLEWCVPSVSAQAKQDFRRLWTEALAPAHQVPVSLLLRDYHVANLMLLPEKKGVRQAGLLDFQDAYAGPVTYDLMSLLEDARRDVPAQTRQEMIDYYLKHFPDIDRESFESSMTILAALRHTRVLAIFERLSQRDRHEYKKDHSPRVRRMLNAALAHPSLTRLKQWFDMYDRQN